MKTMTCKELHGPCDARFQAETVEEMIQKSQKHGMEMAAKGDEDHIRVMEEMKKHGNDPERVREWMEQTKADFDTLPDDK